MTADLRRGLVLAPTTQKMNECLLHFPPPSKCSLFFLEDILLAVHPLTSSE